MDLPRNEAGHEWLSAHLYFEGDVHGAAGDRVVRDVAAPLAGSCRGDAARWFFLRYFEDGGHLRIRFFAPAEVNEATIWPRITAAASASKRVERVERVPYLPEVERYGGPWGLALGEELFHASSETALALLAKVEPGDRPARLGKALLAMLVLFHTYERDADRAAELADFYAASYLRAWAPDPERQKRWHAAFQEGFDRQADHLADYTEAVWDALESDGELTPELDVYRRAMAGFARRLRGLFEAKRLRLGAEIADDWPRCVRRIVPSYLHMMNNRLGVSLQEESYLSVLISKTLGADPTRSP